jgi:hypothetical protein
MARRRKRAEVKPAAQAVFSLLKKLGLSDQARKLRIAAAWAQAVGPEIASRTEPQRFSRGVLVVKSASPAWQNELTFLKAEIMQKVNAALGGKGMVRELKVVGGTLESGPVSVERPTWLDEPSSPDDVDVARDASQPIQDPEIKRAFERLLLLNRRRQRVSK